LIRQSARLLQPLDRRALDNVNTPEEYAQALAALDEPPKAHAMQLKIQYYALMREQAGRSEEWLETSAATPAGVYDELAARYPFYLDARAVESGGQQRVQRLVRALEPGDAVVFIPPVAGG